MRFGKVESWNVVTTTIVDSTPHPARQARLGMELINLAAITATVVYTDANGVTGGAIAVLGEGDTWSPPVNYVGGFSILGDPGLQVLVVEYV